MSYENKVAVITGGAQRIGKTIAEGFKRNGCNVWHYRHKR